MITIFHVLEIGGLLAGASIGYRLGAPHGIGLGLAIGALGGAAGLWLGRRPWIAAIRAAIREHASMTTQQIRDRLHDTDGSATNLLLLELQSRGEDIECELPLILDMLTDDARAQRSRAWHALASAFPDRARLLVDYRIHDPPEVSRAKIERLRNAAPQHPSRPPGTALGDSR